MTDSHSGTEKLTSLFDRAKAENRAVFLPYLTAGIPDPASSVELFVAMAEAGADGFEVGIPYADPLMDGPLIMAAGQQALKSGITVEVAFDIARQVIEQTGKPVLLMTYTNPVIQLGVRSFFDRAADIGASGVIIADLPVDEAEPFVEAAAGAQIGLVLFAAPTTTDTRLRAVADAHPAFVYAIAEVGVTGERLDASANTEELARRIRSVTDAAIVFGVGISTPEHAAKAARWGDGVIVGTAIVRRVMEAPDVESAKHALSEAVGDLAGAMKRGEDHGIVSLGS
jgi:tryptophan synthase alpha chain